MFNILGYQMDWVEFLGTIFNLWSVWLVAVGSILTWPVGIVGVILFAVLFYRIQLYSDMLEQVYYFITGFMGWWMWAKDKNRDEKKLVVYKSTKQEIIFDTIVIILGTAILTLFVSRLHLIFPTIFLIPASYPFLDALTTVMSFTAQWLMAKKRVECWYLWISVDVIGIGLYFAKGVVFVSLLYAVFLGLAIKGLLKWRKSIN